ncbi:MAG: hypothetical protein WA877_04260, partial [Legionella sp.]
ASGAWCRSLNVWKHYLIIITMHIQFFYPFFQCVKIKIRVELSASDRTMYTTWQDALATYRIQLYTIVCDALMKTKGTEHSTFKKVAQQIKQIEKDIVNIVDPPVESDLYKAIIAITNIVITLLTLGIANFIKVQKTGNLWFFTQSNSGEELRALNKDICHQIKIITRSVH